MAEYITGAADTDAYCVIDATNIETAVNQIVIYFDGWNCGLGASAVLRAIAEHPPPSLWEKFDKIIHIDCTRWKSRRALQRAIVDELKLTQQVAADFDRQDEEDDFSGLDQGSRAEIPDVARVIARSLAQYRCFIFHNGSDGMVDLASCGIPPPELFSTKVFWCFSGRLSVNKEFFRDQNSSHWRFLRASVVPGKQNAILAEEAREMALYTHKLGLDVTPEMFTECFLYYLSLNSRGGKVIDYNWETHASCYWVCVGITGGGQDNQAWELALAMQQHMRLEDYSSGVVKRIGFQLDISTKHWVCITNSCFEEVPPGTTSLFFAPGTGHVSFPNERFHQADQLRVLKLCRCTFNFSSPPFHCCRNLRFLGLDSCLDEQRQLGEEETGERAVETFQRLWVLDVCHTDWELDFPHETDEQVATDIREVHINKGRIWRTNLAWRRLPNLRKLRVAKATRYWWETDRKAQDEIMDMVKMELLDLSGNKTMQVLPSLSGAAGLKTLVLDGTPPSLESFCFDAGAGGNDDKDAARISRISLAGCSRLADFRLSGSLPKLEELDLSQTAVKMLDLIKVREVARSLQRVCLVLVGCKHLRSISWPQTRMRQLRLLRIDTRSSGQDRGEEECLHAFVDVADTRFLQSLEFLWTTTPQLKMDLCLSSTSIGNDDGRSCHEKMGCTNSTSTGQLLAAGLPLPYRDVCLLQTATKIDGSSSAMQFQPLDFHMEIGDGISDITNVATTQARRPISMVMNRVESLHVHDSSSITTVVPEYILLTNLLISYVGSLNRLKWCRVERCPKLDTVFATNKDPNSFFKLKTFWAAHLLMARSIWSGSPTKRGLSVYGYGSFIKLRVIHIHSCPRLTFVLPLSSNHFLSYGLETLHIFCCGDLRQIFPVEQEFQEEIAATHETKGMLQFPKLKDLYLHELPSLQLVCEAKMYAPNLETIHLRGCWSLRRLPATDGRRRQDGRPVAVDCEKECWDELEWDGMEYGHDPSLFQPRHSKYYRKRHLRGTVLR
ncbi:hypothetical protein GQ55_6G035300 [Panicum hallii var. hallii]|uniref:Disease resistance protein At4g27190-like leucine-rich repeats domain-containing protein n=2 Tax=Panicum hallii var. hallii TaxID=1504633 RepID=A0A2T7D3E5_9POAL|nr:hypothetical protein GQ55_6G035300 [Panicum hallii var. hallii]